MLGGEGYKITWPCFVSKTKSGFHGFTLGGLMGTSKKMFDPSVFHEKLLEDAPFEDVFLRNF